MRSERDAPCVPLYMRCLYGKRRSRITLSAGASLCVCVCGASVYYFAYLDLCAVLTFGFVCGVCVCGWV